MTGEHLKKPLTDKHRQANAAGGVSAVLPIVTVSQSHFSAQPAAVASDANISTLSLLSVGPYEEFAVSIMLYVHYFLSVNVLHIFVIFITFL